MAIHHRRRSDEKEEESVFISMTDLMISILFIIMILMAYFSLRDDPNIETIEKSKFDKLEIELALSEELVEKRDRRIARLLELIEVFKIEIKKLEVDVSILKKDLKLVETQRDEAISKNIKYQEDILVLEALLDDYERELKGIEELQRAIEIQKKISDNLSKENNKLKLDKLALKDELKGKVPKKRVVDQQAVISDLEKDIGALRKDIATQALQIDELKEKLKNFEKRSIETVLNAIARDRRHLLESIRQSLEDSKIKVEVFNDSGIVRFSEKALRFGSAQYEPTTAGREVIKILAEVLSKELPCFTLGPKTEINLKCNPNTSIVETVQIEGHTDNIPISQSTINRGIIKDNLQLSTMRAAETFRIVIKNNPNILEFFNANNIFNDDFNIKDKPGQSVLSVSGYGDARPIEFENTIEARSANRRIDLRFIMMTPRNLNQANKIAKNIKLGMEKNR